MSPQSPRAAVISVGKVRALLEGKLFDTNSSLMPTRASFYLVKMRQSLVWGLIESLWFVRWRVLKEVVQVMVMSYFIAMKKQRMVCWWLCSYLQERSIDGSLNCPRLSVIVAVGKSEFWPIANGGKQRITYMKGHYMALTTIHRYKTPTDTETTPWPDRALILFPFLNHLQEWSLHTS